MRKIGTVTVFASAVGTALMVVSGHGVSASTEGGLHRAQQPCPSTYQDPTFRDYPALNRVMVPRRPVQLIVCRYTGLNSDEPRHLDGIGLVGRGARIRRAVHIYNELPAPPRGPTSCPADFGSEIVARFSYRDRPDDVIRQDLSGCRFGTNGHRTVETSGKHGRRLLRLLKRISAS